MTQTIEDRIREMLKHTVIGVRGYPVKKIGILTEWEGKNVYGFYLDVDEPIQIGIPWFYLVEGDEITVSSIEQSIDIMAKIYDETHGPDDEDDRCPPSDNEDRGPAHPPGSPMFFTEASSLPRARCPEPSACM